MSPASASPDGNRDDGSPVKVLLVTKGHPFQREPFFAVFDADPGIVWTHVEQPAAQALLHPDRAAGFDVIAFYDMPGITFTRSDPPTVFEHPPAQLVADMTALVEAGKGLVFLHHAVAGWPAWPEYARLVGGRFHYQPASLLGIEYPDSGYRFDITHRVSVVDPSHPICVGLGDGFELTDELYLYPVLETEVVPLLRSSAPFTDDQFFSSDRAIRGDRGTREGWSHPPGSDLVGWVKHAGNSPVAYLQFGDGPSTYADPAFRLVLGNALRWAASPEAHGWARDRRATLGHDGWTQP